MIDDPSPMPTRMEVTGIAVPAIIVILVVSALIATLLQPPQAPLTPIEATLAADGTSVATTLPGWRSVDAAMVERSLPADTPPHFSVSVIGGHTVLLTAPGIQSCLGVEVDVSSPRPRPLYATWTPAGDSCGPLSSVPASS